MLRLEVGFGASLFSALKVKAPVRHDQNAVSPGHRVLVVYRRLADPYHEYRGIGLGMVQGRGRLFPHDGEEGGGQHQNHRKLGTYNRQFLNRLQMLCIEVLA